MITAHDSMTLKSEDGMGWIRWLRNPEDGVRIIMVLIIQ